MRPKTLAILSLTIVSLTASPGMGLTTEDFRINVGSFSNVTFVGGTSPTRAIEQAATKWRGLGGLAWHFRHAGSTTNAGCGLANSNHIYAVPGCNLDEERANGIDDCNVLAKYEDCPFGGWRVVVFVGGSTETRQCFDSGGNPIGCPRHAFSLGEPASLSNNEVFDLETVIQHELGHRGSGSLANVGHIDPGIPCTMNQIFLEASTTQRQFCKQEIDAYSGSGNFGHEYLRVEGYTFAGYPAPTNSLALFTMNPALTVAAGTGLSAVRAERLGVLTQRFFDSDRTAIWGTSYPTASTSASNSFASYHRPTVVFDPIAGRWHMFFVEAVGQGPFGRRRIMWSTSTTVDAIGTWSNPVAVGSASSTAVSRFPPGAAFDHCSGRLVLLYGDERTETSSRLMRTSISGASATGGAGTWLSPVEIVGESVNGPPALACENSCASRNCEVFLPGTDASRRIWNFGIGFNSNGTIFSKSQTWNTGGWTDFHLGVTDPGTTQAGDFVAVHRGTDGLIYFMSKANASANWPAWTQTTAAVGVSGIGVGVSNTTSNYHVLFGR
jgi:hypothetical protein